MVYTPEHGMDLDLLRNDMKFLKTRYALDVKGKSEGRIVIRYGLLESTYSIFSEPYFNRNEAASSVYTTEFITKMLKEEGGALFDARSASLGHTLQGGIPSPMDRARAVRLSLKCMAFIEKQHEAIHSQQSKVKQAGPETAAVITIQGSTVKWVPVQEMVKHADMKNRRGKNAWWGGIKELVEALVGLPQLSGL